MKRTILSLVAGVALSALLLAPAVAQTPPTETNTPTVTPTATITPTSTPTFTPTNTPTKTAGVRVPTLTRQQEEQIGLSSPGAQQGGLNKILSWLIGDTNASVKVHVATGTNGTAIAMPEKVGQVVAIIAITTSSGAVASKALLTYPTDYTLSAAGVLTAVGNHSAETWIVVYRRR
jgi:hypothetical protein